MLNKIELYSHSYPNSPALEITIQPNQVAGQGSIYAPTLSIPLEMRLNRLFNNDHQMKIDYTLVQIGGSLTLANHELLSSIPTQVLIERTNEQNRSIYPHLLIMLDLKRIELMEQFRSGEDMHLMLQFWGVGTIDSEVTFRFVNFRARHIGLDFKVPQSIWIKNVLSKWRYTDAYMVEINKSKIDTEKIPNETFEHLKKAEKHLLSLNSRETMASLYSAFEALAKKHGMTNPDKNLFTKLLGDLPKDMRDKYRDLFHEFCDLLHLGRHELKKENGSQQQKQGKLIDQKDAKLALIFGQTILSYLSNL